MSVRKHLQVRLIFLGTYGQSSAQIFSQAQSSPQTIYCSQGRAVLATNLDGLIGDFSKHGLFVGEIRLLSHYSYFVDGKAPQTVAVSNVEQHSCLGYYIGPAPGAQWKQDTGSGEMEESSEERARAPTSTGSKSGAVCMFCGSQARGR